MKPSPNKITGANAGERRQFANASALGRPRRSVLTLGGSKEAFAPWACSTGFAGRVR